MEVLLALLAVPIASVALWSVVRWPTVGLGAISLVILAEFDIPALPTLASFGGIGFSAADIIASLLLISAAFKRSRTIGDNRVRIAAAPYGLFYGAVVMLVLSAARGVELHGTQAALNEFRAWAYILCIFVWCSVQFARGSFSSRAIESWLAFTAAGVVATAALRIATFGLGNASSAVRSLTGELLIAGRPITSGQAMVVATAGVLMLAKAMSGGGRLAATLSAVYLSTVIVAQHRSVWVAAFVGGMVVVIHHAGKALKAAIIVIPIAAVAFVVIIATGRFNPLFDLLNESATDSATYDGRVFDWLTLIERNILAGYEVILMGQPFGAGWLRAREDGLLISYIPHNWYVSVGLRAGLVGLTLLVAWLVVVLLRTAQLRTSPPVVAVTLAIAVYAWAYNVNWYLAPVLAWATFLASRRLSSEAQPRPTHPSQWAIH